MLTLHYIHIIFPQEIVLNNETKLRIKIINPILSNGGKYVRFIHPSRSSLIAKDKRISLINRAIGIFRQLKTEVEGDDKLLIIRKDDKNVKKKQQNVEPTTTKDYGQTLISKAHRSIWFKWSNEKETKCPRARFKSSFYKINIK